MQEWFMGVSNQRVLYLLSLLAVAMGIDFFSGILLAKIRGEITSKIGINGILRKIASMILLVFFLPVAKLIPGNTGMILLYILYIGYLFLEMQSILENYQKSGIDTRLFEKILTLMKELFKK
uniref:phage holin family protein n=1 Tax=Candidatus Enterococcus willemsii TaxID=1857215 RepID=UPI00403F7422